MIRIGNVTSAPQGTNSWKQSGGKILLNFLARDEASCSTPALRLTQQDQGANQSRRLQCFQSNAVVNQGDS